MIRPLLFFALASAATGKTLTDQFHHLRNAEPREWSHYPQRAEGPRLQLSFDLGDDLSSYQLLTLRQAGIKEAWPVVLNGRRLGELERDHNDQELALVVPAGVLKTVGNLLEIATGSTVPDDIRVGEIELHCQSLQALTTGAGLSIAVTDADGGRALPCRLTIADARSQSLALLRVQPADGIAARAGVIYTLDGRAEIGLRPGRYKVWAGRGFEYSLASSEIELGVGGRAEIALQLRREVPTPGLVACDTHLHTGEFAGHGDATLLERLVTLAGEGIELPISTEHDQHIDYSLEARRIGAADYFSAVLGCEVTTSEGHFNAFPIVAGSQPAQHRLRQWPQVFENMFATPGVRVVILNHPRDLHGKFRPFGTGSYDAENGRFIGGRKLEANGLELINSGAQQSDPMQLVQDWFALLRSGHQIAGVGSSDSHTVNFAIVGQARTYVPCADGDVANLDVAAAVEGFLSGETHVSFGLLARLELVGDGMVRARVLGPGWTRADKLILFADGVAVDEVAIGAADGEKPGLKVERSWSLAQLGIAPGSFLVVVASGPGIDAPFWPMMPPYQAATPEYNPYVMGISPVRRVK